MSETKPIKYSKDDKLKIAQLKEYGVELSGTETTGELDTLLSIEQAKGEAPTEAEELEGVPNNLPPHFEEISVGGKPAKIGIFFVAAVKGGFALYNNRGQRASPRYSAGQRVDPGDETSKLGIEHINKAAAIFNTQRRKNLIAGQQID